MFKLCYEMSQDYAIVQVIRYLKEILSPMFYFRKNLEEASS